eukprot:CFRG1316T1
MECKLCSCMRVAFVCSRCVHEQKNTKCEELRSIATVSKKASSISEPWSSLISTSTVVHKCMSRVESLRRHLDCSLKCWAKEKAAVEEIRQEISANSTAFKRNRRKARADVQVIIANLDCSVECNDRRQSVCVADASSYGMVSLCRNSIRIIRYELLARLATKGEDLSRAQYYYTTRLKTMFQIEQLSPGTTSVVNLQLYSNDSKSLAMKEDIPRWKSDSGLMYIAQILLVLARYYGVILPVSVHISDFADKRKSKDHLIRLGTNIKYFCQVMDLALIHNEVFSVLLNLTQAITDSMAVELTKGEPSRDYIGDHEGENINKLVDEWEALEAIAPSSAEEGEMLSSEEFAMESPNHF